MIKRTLTNLTNMINDSVLTGNDTVIHGVSIDSRTIVPGNIYIPIVGPNSNGHHYIAGAIDNGAVATLWGKNEPNPPEGIPVIFVEDTLIALQQLATSYKQELQEAKFIGITGSNGKTSIKDILHSVLSTSFKSQKTQGNFNNHIGVPLTLLSLDEDVEMAVIEMGMDHKGEIAFLSEMVKPDIAIISNIGNAHLATMGSLENIAEAKMEIIQGLKKSGLLIVNGDYSLLLQGAKQHDCAQYTFGTDEENQLYLTSCHQLPTSVQFTVSDCDFEFNLPLIGQHQAINCLSVIKVARMLDISDELIQKGFSNVVLSSQRNEVKIIGDITIINDTYKSNPESVKAALDTIDSLTSSQRKLFIMGDMADMGDQDIELHERVGVYLSEKNVDTVFAIGDLSYYTIASIKGETSSIKANYYKEESALIEAIIEYTKKPCIVLFKASRALHFERVVEAIEKRLTT